MAFESNTPQPHALTGLRVLDLTGCTGGYCGLLLANLGADVVLVEPPGGDPMRRRRPFKDDVPHPDGSLSFLAYHTNKRGIVLDIDSDQGRETLGLLARHADIVIEDKPVGYLDKIGLGYNFLRATNSRLILISITGFGLTGPYRNFKSPSIVGVAMGGLMNLCGHPGRPPLMGPCDVAYHLGSIHAAFGALVALFNRYGTGCGEHVEVSLQDVLVSDPFLRVITRYSVTGEILERLGHGQSSTVAESYKCKDGYARVYVTQPDHWRRLVQWLGNPLELTDPKLENVQTRFLIRSQIDRIIEARSVEMEMQWLFEALQSQRLAAAPINSPGAFLGDEQTKHREYVVEVDHSHLGRHHFPGDPYRFSRSPWRVLRGAPRLDEHKEEVTREFSRPSQWSANVDKHRTSLSSKSLLFEGIRVVSFPTGIVGPALASLLAQHGAEVISIEAGRTLRSPQRGKRWQLISDLESNHSKKRIAINMKHPEGQALAKQLIAKSDVVAENYSAHVMASWGLDYPRIREVRADIIMASLQAFGQTGPRRDFVSFGPTLMAFSGMSYLWRDPDIERPGAACQTAFPDFIAPAYGAVAILAALHYRANTGEGQYIDISQAETAASMIGPAYLEWLINRRELQPQGNFSSYAAPHGCYRCKGDDRWCVISVETQEEWVKFCEVIDHKEWASNPHFCDVSARLAHRDELNELVESWTMLNTPHQVMLILQHEGIAAGVVQTAEDLYRDPHLRERGLAREVFDSQMGAVTRVGPSVHSISSQVPRDEMLHMAGEDNEAVLGELLGITPTQVRNFTERDVLR